MIFALNLMMKCIIASNEAEISNKNVLTSKSMYKDVSSKKCYGYFSDLINSFNKVSTNEIFKLNNNLFSKFLSILKLYPTVNMENPSFHFNQYLKSIEECSIFFRIIFGHFKPTLFNITPKSKKRIKLRNTLDIESFNDIKNSMSRLREYNYPKILSFTCEDNLLFSITLSAFFENIGIIYLRLLSGNPYYRDDDFFIRDFITHTASFLHFINLFYKYSLDDDKIMSFFRIFAAKNIKLLCIFKYFWTISYESIFNELNNPKKDFMLSNVNKDVHIDNLNNSKKKFLKLEAFNSEIQSLFEFILKINLNLKFKKEFKLLKTSESFSSDNLVNMIKNFDKERLLGFFTEKCNNDKKIKDPDYFLNSLDMENFIPDNILTNIESKLYFIENQSIKKYFIEMLLVSCSGDCQQLMQKIEHISKKRRSINFYECFPKKLLKVSHFDCKMEGNSIFESKIVKYSLHHVQPIFNKDERSANIILAFKQVKCFNLLKQDRKSDEDEPLYLYFKK